MKTRISIITPSYNQAQFLEATIGSVLIQDYPYIEYIIVDGGSTDGSVEIIQQYADRLAWWVSEPDQGQADALQKGFQHATGDILTWLNSDDVYISTKVLSQVANYFQTFPDLDVITGNGMYLDETGRWMRAITNVPDYFQATALQCRNAVLQPATFIHRRAWKKVRLDTTLHYAFDWNLWIQLAQQSNWLAVPEIWAGYRWWGENKTARGDALRTREQAEVLLRSIGPRSWQYLIMRIFAAIFALSEHLPAFLETTIKQAVKLFSRLLSKLTRRKIPLV
jgi:glycosyltransferase involved in cell wall biosynthesis